MLTRGVDEFIPLRSRVARARARLADLFLSIHADALPDAAMQGLSVFTLSAQASDREAAALAELGCLSNPQKEHLLPQRAYQHKLARGLVRAVEAYFAAHPVS